MNPCNKCGVEPLLDVDCDNFATLVCQSCGNVWKYNAWNDNNPLPEPDPLAKALERLDELYCFLDEIEHMDLISIRLWANDLLGKYRFGDE